MYITAKGHEQVFSEVILPVDYNRLHIREFSNDDKKSLMDFVHDKGQLKYMLFSLGTEKELDDFFLFEKSESEKKPRMHWHFALEEKGISGCIGGAALMIEPDAPTSAELGYWFKRSMWGKGYATEVSRFMLDVGFSRLGLHRIWAKCHVDNPASEQVLEKLGMQKEGLVREHVWLRDHFRSSFLYSMLENEYSGSITK